MWPCLTVSVCQIRVNKRITVGWAALLWDVPATSGHPAASCSDHRTGWANGPSVDRRAWTDCRLCPKHAWTEADGRRTWHPVTECCSRAMRQTTRWHQVPAPVLHSCLASFVCLFQWVSSTDAYLLAEIIRPLIDQRGLCCEVLCHKWFVTTHTETTCPPMQAWTRVIQPAKIRFIHSVVGLHFARFVCEFLGVQCFDAVGWVSGRASSP